MSDENREATDERREASKQAAEDRHPYRFFDRGRNFGHLHDKHSALIVGRDVDLNSLIERRSIP
jgi:hypothetical protein